MGIKISALDTMTTPDGTETMVGVQTSTKNVLLSVLDTFHVKELSETSTVTPAISTDKFLGFRAGATTAELIDIDDISSYAIATAWAVASTVTPAVSGDLVLVNRSGTIYELDVDTIRTYINLTHQADVLDISGLGSATLDATDLFLIGEGATPKIATLTELETKLHTDFGTYTAGLSDIAALADADRMYVLDAGVAGAPKYATMLEVATYVKGEVAADVIATAWDAASEAPIGTDVFIYEGADAAQKTCTLAMMTTFMELDVWTQDDNSGWADADQLLCDRSGTFYTGTAANLATYVSDAMWAAVGSATFAAGDKLMTEVSGVAKTLTQAQLVTAIQPIMLLLAGLSAASISSSDLFLVDDGPGAAKKLTLAALETQLMIDRLAVWDTVGTTPTGTPAIATTNVLDADKIFCVQGGIEKTM